MLKSTVGGSRSSLIKARHADVLLDLGYTLTYNEWAIKYANRAHAASHRAFEQIKGLLAGEG